jgi:DNA-binding transcriptional ArsR family regulator
MEMTMPLREEIVEDIAKRFGVLGHPTRVQLLAPLHQGEHDASYLKEHLGVLAATVSQHLSLLRAHHLVKVRREGNPRQHILGLRGY